MGLADHTASFIWYVNVFALHLALSLAVVAYLARLRHTGARALATRGCASPVQVNMLIIGADGIVVDHESGAKRS